MYVVCGIRTFPMRAFPPRNFSPQMKSSIYAELSVINPTSTYRLNYFHQSHFHFNKERFSSNVRVVYIDFWANFVNFYRFRYTAKSSFITPASSYQEIVSSIQLLLKEYCFIIPVSIQETLLRFFSAGKSPGEKWPRAVFIMMHIRIMLYTYRTPLSAGSILTWNVQRRKLE